MHNTNNSNVRNGKPPLRTFVVFGIILLVAVGNTWWLTKQHYDHQKMIDPVFASLDSTIQTINLQLLQDNMYEYDEMRSWTNNPAMIEKANLWKPKLDSVVWQGIHIHQFFERLKQDMFMHPHDTEANEIDFRNLYDSLLHFKEDLLSILPDNRREWLQPLPIGSETANISRSFFYKNLSDSGRIAVLSKIEFSALQSVNQVVHVLSSQIAYHPIVYDQFDVLIGQNSTYLLPGQTLEVSAGLGAYSTSAKPIIIMNGQVIPTNEYGVALYKKSVSAKDSSSKINVSISFKDPATGLTKTKSMIIGYAVLQPKN